MNRRLNVGAFERKNEKARKRSNAPILERTQTMARLLHLFTALLATALLLTACGGQEIAQEAPEPTPAAEIISDEATADATSAPAEEESEETTDEAAADESPAAASP